MTLCSLQHSKEITIFKTFIWCVCVGGEVYCQKNCLKSRLMALLTKCHLTKFQTAYLTIYFPKWKFWIQLSFNISSEIVWCHKLCNVTQGFQLGFLVVFVIFPISVLGPVWYLILSYTYKWYIFWTVCFLAIWYRKPDQRTEVFWFCITIL